MREKLVSRTTLAVLIAVFCGLFSTGYSAQMQSSGAAPSLYKRLGGYDAIAAVTDDFLGRLAADKQMSRFFVGVSTDSLKKLRQHVILQLCEATGGSCNYFGRSMKTTHAGLGITESDWQITVKHLNGTLDLFNVPKKERNEILTLFASLKRDIVEQ